MKIAVLQSHSVRGSWQANAGAVRRAAAEGARAGATILITPELFLSSYDPTSVADDPGEVHRRELADIAQQCGIHLVASTVEADGASRYISASIFSPADGELTRHRKSQLFGEAEHAVFTPGASVPEIVTIGSWKVAVGICFEVEFPEFVRDVAVRGAEILLVPTAVPLRPDQDGVPHPLDTRMLSTLVVPCRAYESQLFLAYANHAGPGFSGHSTVADPFGARVATAADGDELMVVELDRDRLTRARSSVAYLDIARGRMTDSDPSKAEK